MPLLSMRSSGESANGVGVDITEEFSRRTLRRTVGCNEWLWRLSRLETSNQAAYVFGAKIFVQNNLAVFHRIVDDRHLQIIRPLR